MNKKKIILLVAVVVILFIVWRRWVAFKTAAITAQQAANEALIAKGQAPSQVSNPTVINFLTGSVSTSTDSSGTSANSEGRSKSALIDALAVKHNFTFTTGQEQALMTYSVAQLEDLLSKTQAEVATFLGL